MILHGARDAYDPPLEERRCLHPLRLAASNALDVSLRRREVRSHRLMRWTVHGFWAAVCAAIVARIVWG